MPQHQPATAAVNEGAPSSVGHPAPERGRVALSALWFGLFGGPLAWSAQTLVNLTIASHACFPRLTPLSTPTTGGLRGIVFVVSLAALATCVAAVIVALRAWSLTRGEQQGQSGQASGHAQSSALLETGEGRTRFMALAGLLTSLTFVVVIAAHAATVFMVAPCGW